MNFSRHILAALILAVVLGVGVYSVVGYAYSHHMLSYDTSDGHGHGPDPGTPEDRYAYAYGTARQSRMLGFAGAMLGFAAPFAFTFLRRSRVA